MKTKLHCLLSVLLAFCIAIYSATVYAESKTVEHDKESFNIEGLDPLLTLSELLLEYPEVYDIFFFEKISDEEALKAIQNGMTVINGDAFSAKEFLSSLNGRKNTKTTINNGKIILNREYSRSPYGAALPYISKTGAVPNCYGYVIGVDQDENPGAYSNLGSINYGANLETILARVSADMGQSFDGGGRRIASDTASIECYEWRIAFRTGTHLIYTGYNYVVTWDYHFWRQTSTGTWCHKPGQDPSVHLGYVTPHTASWDKGSYTNFYNSETYYMALTVN